MSTASVGGSATSHSSAAPDAVAPSEPRQVVIQVPFWLLLLPLAALGLYYCWADGLLQGSPVAALPIHAAEPHVNRAAVVTERRAVPERQGVAAPSVEDHGPRADTPSDGNTSARAAARPPEAPELRAQAARGAEVRREREQAAARELAAAREDVDVIVYFTEWCPACRSVRAYLASRGIRSVEHDVEKDRRASARQRQLNPRRSVPTIEIEGQVLVGFNAKKIEQAIDRAARTRIARLEQGL